VCAKPGYRLPVTGLGLSLRKAAKALEISHVALIKAVRAGRVQKEPDGTFDVDKCRQELAANSHPGKQKSARAQQRPPAGPPAASTEYLEAQAHGGALKRKVADPEEEEGNYNEACRALEWLKVEKLQIELARKRGELAPIAEVNAFVAGMITRARDILLRIDCDERTRREISRALGELSEFEANGETG
jgi:hypothetical protein